MAAISLAVTAALMLAGCGPGGPAPGAAAPALAAKIVQVSPQRVPIELETVGQVAGSKEVEVRARVGGILLKRMYNEGEVVREGAPLFQIDPEPYRIALESAKAQLAQEKARRDQAAREADRLKGLIEQRAISRKEYDDATSTKQLSDAAMQSAEAGVRQAELNLSYTQVTAPIGGVTGSIARSEGSLVTTGADSLLTTINQVNPIWVRFSLSDSDLAKLPGAKLVSGAVSDLRLVLPDGKTYAGGKGRINFSATQIDPRLATQQMRAEFDNPKIQLLPGQFVRVQIVGGQRDNVFLVPQTAVLQNEKGYFVFVVDKEEKAAIRPVKTGDWVGTDATILSGLSAGDRVIADNLMKVRPGTLMKAADDAKPAAPAAAK
ncbi:MAG: efflux RND transporter periplasmic adaptor subunit [Rhodospirillales bacterium]